jgi:putative endopeptidase
MPSYLSSYGVSEEIETRIESELSAILYSALHKVQTKEDKHIDHSTTLLGTFMQSVLHVPSQEKNVVFTERLLAKFGCMRDCSDVCSVLGDAAAHRVRHAPLAVTVGPRETETNNVYITIGPGELILPDTSYYTDKSPSMVRNLEAFVKLLQWVGTQFNIEGLELVFPQEYAAAQALKKSEYEHEKFTTGAALEKHYKNFNWEAFVGTAFAGMSMSEFRKMPVINARPSWMAAVDRWCKKYDVDMWRRWLSAQVIFYHLPYLPPPYDDAHFRFFGARLRDQAEKLPQHKLAIYAAQNHLSAPLGEIYIKEYAPRGSLKKAHTLAEELVTVAADRLGNCAWLSADSRKEARAKVRTIALNIGIPRGGPAAAADYLKTVQLSSTGFIENIYTLNAAAQRAELRRAGRRLDRYMWSEPVYMVNAFYYPEGNRLVIPAGIIRHPFYSEKNGVDINPDGLLYGALGSTIGHELTHAFDMDGKDFDAEGNYKPWWSTADIAHYKKLTDRLVRLYEDSMYFGKHLNGRLTLSENIADLGGVAFALEALKRQCAAQHLGTKETDEALREFFIGYAVSWRTKEKRGKALQGLFMDVHSPPAWRVNNIVCHFDDWYRLFDVKPGDELYVDPQDRIRIF